VYNHNSVVDSLKKEHENTVTNYIDERDILVDNHSTEVTGLNKNHNGELLRQNISLNENIKKQDKEHEQKLDELKDQHGTNIINKLRLFQTTKEDHSNQNDKTKKDNDAYYVQFKIVQDALLKKTQDEGASDKIKLNDMNESAKKALHGKIESVSTKQYMTEKGFEALREQYAHLKYCMEDKEFQLKKALGDNEKLKNDIRSQFQK